MKKIITLLFIAFCLHLKAQIINTVVGSGPIGFAYGSYSGDGGQATAATISYPSSMTFDADGNLYFSDYDNNRIRKVSTTGIITTIVGIGGGYSGDGGPATAARLNHPIGVALDTSGNLFIADYDNDCIRKVNTNGIISTVAGVAGMTGHIGDGGPATLAELYSPYSIAVDISGNLFIADYSNDAIRKVNTAGIITTIVGNGSGGFLGDGGQATNASLEYPMGVTLDTYGNIYIADANNYRIRKVNTAGIITTIAGNGTPGYSGDGGPATLAQLKVSSQGIAVDNVGNVYIADATDIRVRMINTSGIISTVVGGVVTYGTFGGDGGQATAAYLDSPSALTFDASGNLFICDIGNNRIRMVSPALNLSVNSSTVCASNTTTLTAQGAASYTWSPATNLNTNTGAVVVANPPITTSYTLAGSTSFTVLNVSNISTCTIIDTVTIVSPTINYTLTAAIAPPHTWNAYPTYSSNVTSAKWYWGDGTSTTGFYPSHTYSVAGKYNICVTVFSSCGDSSTYCQNDSVYRYSNNNTLSNMIYVNILNGNQTTGINQISINNNTINIYPNPTQNDFVIETSSTDKQTLQVFDVNGKLVLTQTISGKTNIDVSNLSEGVYNLSLQNSNGVVNKRLVIVR